MRERAREREKKVSENFKGEMERWAGLNNRKRTKKGGGVSGCVCVGGEGGYLSHIYPVIGDHWLLLFA
jgi:hypothetical protein